MLGGKDLFFYLITTSVGPIPTVVLLHGGYSNVVSPFRSRGIRQSIRSEAVPPAEFGSTFWSTPTPASSRWRNPSPKTTTRIRRTRYDNCAVSAAERSFSQPFCNNICVRNLHHTIWIVDQFVLKCRNNFSENKHWKYLYQETTIISR